MSSAILSSCTNYRYRLEREIESGGNISFAFFGVNPSTADASVDDPTVRRWRGFARSHFGARFIVGNVFSYRSTDVKQLARVADPVGELNEQYITQIIADSDVLVPCWGSRTKLPKVLRPMLDEFMEMLINSAKPVMCFGKTRSGDPKHPLMLARDTRLVRWQ